MNRKEAAKILPIIKAFSEGKDIEIKTGLGWISIENMSFEGNPEYYRIKPEPKYRPFKNAEECWKEMLKHQPFGWVVSKRDRVIYLLRSLTTTSVYTSIQYLFKDAFNRLTFVDGTPFGILEEE